MGLGLETVDALRDYEARTLRPRWDFISRQAEEKSGLVNWASAPADAWNRVDAESYADMVVKWGIQVSRILQTSDPAGTSKDQALESLRAGFQFHVDKMAHLQKLGISVPETPSIFDAVLKGLSRAVSDLPNAPFDWVKWIAVAAAALLAAIFFLKRPRG